MHRCRHKDIAQHDTDLCKAGGNMLLPFLLGAHIKVFVIPAVLTHAMLFAMPITFTLIYS